ncbi:FAD-dependent oxidoreductase [Temperatibacter marinus]|uniref:FAD-dependent oxidoreductase n=1 Tax=Temperatibacter marinus TaxID=1456591 RepID=A0AA52HBF8_9PROT|nr:FAD-dependent oxidoreductase [Temperatibacter marinus]WND03593.1 FAD-dependent oxidoreductase [Temperatibacter marinus]
MPHISSKYAPVIPAAVQTGKLEKATVLIVGAGPIGLATALELGLRGHNVTLLDRSTQVSDGSRAICFAKRSLEIMDRLGYAQPMLDKGLSWNIGRVFFKDNPVPVYSFDLLPLKDQKLPGMINIQQYYNEEFCIAELVKLKNVEIRWGNEVADLINSAKGVTAQVLTLEGGYEIEADWVIACDGSKSLVREKLAVGFEGETFQDNFLIADLKFKQERPVERHFWFDPSFNPGKSALLHKQPDDVWRVDLQVGWDIDREEIARHENVTPYIKAMFGDDIEFEYEWVSVYTFNCRQVKNMVVDRVIFAGDSAHLVSPFGARGANTGFQDTDNIGWKMDLVLRGLADIPLIESYDEERSYAAKVNILNSTRSTDFITPKSTISKTFRDAVLELSHKYEFARGFVNSGRLSLPVAYHNSRLNTLDRENWAGGVAPGANSIDAPISLGTVEGWFIDQVGSAFKVILFCDGNKLSSKYRSQLKEFCENEIPSEVFLVSDFEVDPDFKVINDCKGLLAKRLDAQIGTAYLFRPDQYVAGRWKKATASDLFAARDRALAKKVGRNVN